MAMFKLQVIILCITAALILGLNTAITDELSDAEIKKNLIKQSIRSYSGACPCPYSVMRNGRRCGKNNAYSKPGGAEPLCHDTDVPDEMVERYRAKMK